MRILIAQLGILMLALPLAASTAYSADAIKADASDVATQTRVIAEALKIATPVKTVVAKYRLTHDGFPANNAEAGILEPELFAGDYVKQVSIGPDGVVGVTLTAASGVDDGVIQLRPTLARGSGQMDDITWKCSSASFANIGDLTQGTCEYSKVP